MYTVYISCLTRAVIVFDEDESHLYNALEYSIYALNH